MQPARQSEPGSFANSPIQKTQLGIGSQILELLRTSEVFQICTIVIGVGIGILCYDSLTGSPNINDSLTQDILNGSEATGIVDDLFERVQETTKEILD